MSQVIRFRKARGQPAFVHFTRDEMNRLLSLYSRQVAAGEWRDYAIETGRDCAVFRVYNRANERPAYSFVKLGQTDRKGQYAVFDSQRKLRQSNEITEALAVFGRQLRLVAD